MKKIFLTISLIILFKIIFSQPPNPTNLCNVTVDNNNHTQINWTHPDTTKINGYIIKRIILDGQGVIPGTLNNIAIINNNSTQKYIDTAKAYNTTAKPHKRPEKYSINAFIIRNDSTILSNTTLPQKTIFLTTKWDYCNQKATIFWSKYINKTVLKYQLFCRMKQTNFKLVKEFPPTDTAFYTTSVEKNKNYFFVVKAILQKNNNCTTDTSASNQTSFFSASNHPPDTVINIKISAQNNNKLHIKFFISDTTNIKTYKIYKKINSTEKIIYETAEKTNTITYTDNSNTNQINNYKLTITDNCGKIMTETPYSQNCLLKATNENKKFLLAWSNIKIKNAQADYSIIQYKQNNTQWTDLKQVNSNVNNAKINYAEILATEPNTENKTYIFRIKSIKDTTSSYSNTVELPILTIFAIPNAFNPLSKNPENSYFTIKAKFISKFSLIIFDQNKNIIFQTNNIQNRWNGKQKNGKLVKQGSYIYTITYKNNQEKNNKISGIINVIY